jgi:Uncharacterized membrane protein
MSEKISFGKVMTIGGAMVAYLIGAGFASGQESLQFFASFGSIGILGAGLITLGLYIWFSVTLMEDGKQLNLEQPNDIFQYYCGPYLAKFYEWFTPIFLYSIAVVMCAGAGAIANEYYGVDAFWGRLGLMALTACTALLGLRRMIDIVGKIGPLIILFGIVVGAVGIYMAPAGALGEADELLKTLPVNRAASHWALSGTLFSAFGCVLSMPFFCSLGKIANTRTEARLGGLVGALMFVGACMTMAYGLLAQMPVIWNIKVPTLALAHNIFPAMGVSFSLILLGAVYSTAAPMFWIGCNRFAADEKSLRFKIVVLVAAVLGLVLSAVDFPKLVNTIYPVSGYLGILLFICVFVSGYKRRLERRKVECAGQPS